MPSEHCDLPPDDLLAFADGELRGARREFVDAALAVSPACRDRLAALELTGRLLRDATPLRDNPAGRAALRARLEQEATHRPFVPRLTGAVSVVALPLVFLVALLLNGPSVFWVPFVTGEDRAVAPEPTPFAPAAETAITGRRGGTLLIAPCPTTRPTATTAYAALLASAQPTGSPRPCFDPVSRRVVPPMAARLTIGQSIQSANDVRADYAALRAQHTDSTLAGPNQSRPGCAAVRTVGALTMCT